MAGLVKPVKQALPRPRRSIGTSTGEGAPCSAAEATWCTARAESNDSDRKKDRVELPTAVVEGIRRYRKKRSVAEWFGRRFVRETGCLRDTFSGERLSQAARTFHRRNLPTTAQPRAGCGCVGCRPEVGVPRLSALSQPACRYPPCRASPHRRQGIRHEQRPRRRAASEGRNPLVSFHRVFFHQPTGLVSFRVSFRAASATRGRGRSFCG